MTDLFTAEEAPLPPVSLAEQIDCVKRELNMRRRVYPGWVDRGKMSQAQADEEIRRMQAVLETLREVDAARRRPDPLGEALNSGSGVYRP